MKFTTLSSAAIVAALTIGALAPTVALAEDPEVSSTELDTIGTVIVEEGGNEPSPGTMDPEKPGDILPEPNEKPGEQVNPVLGPLMIERTSNYDFGTIKTSANEVTAFAAPASFGEEDEEFTRGAYVQWRDVRAGGTYGYTITAEMTQQFTGATSNTLSGATIDFSNGFVVAQGDNTNPVPTDPGAFQLTESGGARTVVTADKEEKEGKGRFLMAFGKNEDDTDGSSVKLTVPAATASNMSVDTYTAKVTWKVIAAQ